MHTAESVGNVTLSRTHHLRDVDSLLGKYAAELADSSERSLAAVQLYRRAGKFLDAAKIVFAIAEDERRRGSQLLRLKKLYVLGALLIEEHHEQSKARAAAEAKETESSAQATLKGLLREEAAVRLEDSKIIDRAWRGAEACHFFMLAHQHIYKGDTDAAMKTALHLTEYDDLLDPVEVYSLLALASCATRQFAVCSRAFMKLESLSELSAEEREAYRKLSLKIFIKYPPTDSRPNHVECPNCDAAIPDYATVCHNCDNKLAVCIVSGRPLHDYQFWLCPSCKHRAFEQLISRLRNCPLCHAAIN